ncbi:orotate phosphoribosyltransferase [Lentibacillus sp. L22]|uniref:orotate phosphoribosyltransferase n=1 Tax=Lentibacillus TaxID=175304 RepID=UPI0022B0DC9A|nr:orotate phosphoribosyltransferase [Lentibacillus daqui]
MKLSHEIAQDLLAIKAVQIRPEHYFTWTSGIKAPIYCDNRLTMSHPAVRNRIAKGFVQLIEQMPEKPDVIAGCATAGIPHAAWVAEKLDLPMVYVRSKPKAHGKGNQIEGTFEKGARVIVIEDLLSTGGSSLQAAKALENNGAIVLGVLAIFSYGLEKLVTQFKEADLPYETLTNYDELLQLLMDNQTIDNDQYQALKAWRHTL